MNAKKLYTILGWKLIVSICICLIGTGLFISALFTKSEMYFVLGMLLTFVGIVASNSK